MNTYEIKKELDSIFSNPNYWDENWEITEDWEQALNENNESKSIKAENIARYMQNIDLDSQAYAREIKRMWELKSKNDKQVKSLKNTLDYLLDWNPLETELFKFSYRASESAEILEKEKLPKQFITLVEVEKISGLPDIKKYLKTEIEARIEELKNDWKEFNEQDIKTDVYSQYGLNITFNKNLQIK
jgi:hypothetical protein